MNKKVDKKTDKKTEKKTDKSTQTNKVNKGEAWYLMYKLMKMVKNTDK